MQRPALILQQLECSLSMPPESVARLLGVGGRTVASEVAALNQVLGSTAQVRLIGGRYRLRVLDPAGFDELRAQLMGGHESFNDPRHRTAHILAQLVLSQGPVRIETLARGMNVGRTTVTADLVELRRWLAPEAVQVQGKPHVGLQLVGHEFDIRLAVLRHAYRPAYGADSLGSALTDVLEASCADFGFDADLAVVIGQWLTVCLDRMLGDHGLDELPRHHTELLDSQAHAFARHLARGIESVSGIQLPESEVLFLAIPAAGRRTPADGCPGSVDDDAQEMVTEILRRIQEVLEIALRPGDLGAEFAQHVGFMLNRLRFGLRVEGAIDASDLAQRFPLAMRMARLAAEVVKERTGLEMDDAELALTATYLQVFLDEEAQRTRRPFRIGLHVRRGPAAISLLKGQLAQALAVPAEYVLVRDAEDAATKGVDLVVAAPGSGLTSGVPTLELSEVFDRGELIRRLSGMHFPSFGPLVAEAPEGSMITLLLEPGHVVELPRGTSRQQAVVLLAELLVRQGAMSDDVAAALEVQLADMPPVRIGDRLWFPHASVAGLRSVTCALGTIPAEGDRPRQAVFLMAVPEKEGYDDRVLVRTYEELIRLGTDSALAERLCAVTGHAGLFRLLDHLRDSQGS